MIMKNTYIHKKDGKATVALGVLNNGRRINENYSQPRYKSV